MGVMEWIAEAKRRIEELSPEEFDAERIGGNAVILDIRDVREAWRDGIIPGARSAPRGMLEFWADPESEYHEEYLRPDRRTLVYCAGGLRSALATEMLMRLGYTNVAHLEAGFDAWKDAGFPVEQVHPPQS